MSAVALSFGSRIMQIFLIPQIFLISSRSWVTDFTFSRGIDRGFTIDEVKFPTRSRSRLLNSEVFLTAAIF